MGVFEAGLLGVLFPTHSSRPWTPTTRHNKVRESGGLLSATNMMNHASLRAVKCVGYDLAGGITPANSP